MRDLSDLDLPCGTGHCVGLRCAKGGPMSDLKITCPTCSSEIELTEQLAGPLVADQRAAFLEQLERQKADAERAVAAAQAQAKEAARAEAAAEAKALAERVKEQDTKLREAQAAQAAALKREQELKDKEAEMELTLQKMLAAERPALEERLAKEAQEKASLKEAEQAQKIDALDPLGKQTDQELDGGLACQIARRPANGWM